jgi:mRNA interferase RelE/StbE
MRYEIVFAPDAVIALRRIRAHDRVAVLDAIEQHLRHGPMRTSKSRTKALRDLLRPQYRLRVGDLRVFYDVTPEQVEVVAVVAKSEAAEWIARWGVQFEQEGEAP